MFVALADDGVRDSAEEAEIAAEDEDREDAVRDRAGGAAGEVRRVEGVALAPPPFALLPPPLPPPCFRMNLSWPRQL